MFTPRKQRATDALIIVINASVMMSYFIHDLSVLLISIATAAALLPIRIFLIHGYFYLLSVPLFAFMVILIWSFSREVQAAESKRECDLARL